MSGAQLGDLITYTAEGWINIGQLRGPAGPAGGVPFVFNQSTPVTPWVITHNLNRHPQVTVQLDQGGGVWEIVDMPIVYVDNNTVQVIPPVPLGGRADLI